MELLEVDENTAFGGDNPGNTTKPGNWWFYGAYCLDCNIQPLAFTCTTSFAKGRYVFTTDKMSNPENLPSLNLIQNRWGWAINLRATGTTTYHIWAGAA